MSETKFTKGEWRVDVCRLTGVASVIPEKGMYTHDSICLCMGDKANAHLIAAAPDMYKMLEITMNILNGDDFENEVSNQDIKELLAKARGEV